MRYFSRLPLLLLSFVFLTYICLGSLAVPALADSTGFLSLINSYRQQNGVGTLVEDQNLTNAACWFAADMADKNYFPSDHVDSLGRSITQRLAAFGVSGGSWGENILQNNSSAASAAFDQWKGSSGHNANMLKSAFTRIGIGRANHNSKWYWVTDFASGAATTLTSQCGVSAAAPPPPPPPAKKVTPPPPPPTAIVTETPVVETPIATSAATELENIATNSATKSAVIVKISEPERKAPVTLVQGIAATSLILGNFALFAFILWRLYRHPHFLR